MPRPDFPRTFTEFVRRFPDDQSCWDYLAQSRWPDGFTCPDGHTGWFSPARQVFECKGGHQWSVTSGTIMHRSKLPLTTWFWAAYLVTTQTPGMSAVQFAKQLSISRYETAYMLFQKLRAGMVNPERGKIGGARTEVEIDEMFVTGGRKSEGRKGELAIVVAALEVRDGHAERLRMQMVPDNKGPTLGAFVIANVERRSMILTDGNPSYRRLEQFGYEHQVDYNADDSEAVLPHLHRIFSNFKTWLLGTHHGAVMHKNLPAYLNEFVFRFNRRNTPMAAFQTVLGIGSRVLGPTYEGIYKGTWTHPNPRGNRW